eukprot:Rmarinus@m.21480
MRDIFVCPCVYRYSSECLLETIKRILDEHDVFLAKATTTGDVRYRPKNHYASKHIIEYMRLYGSCRCFWCMKHEGKHADLKRKTRLMNWNDPCKEMMTFLLKEMYRSSTADEDFVFSSHCSIEFGNFPNNVVGPNDYAIPVIETVKLRFGDSGPGGYCRIKQFTSIEGVEIKPDRRNISDVYLNRTVLRVRGSTRNNVRYFAVTDAFVKEDTDPTDSNLTDKVILTGYMWKLKSDPYNFDLCANEATFESEGVVGLFVSEVDTREVCNICQPLGREGMEFPFYVVDRSFDPCLLPHGIAL